MAERDLKQGEPLSPLISDWPGTPGRYSGRNMREAELKGLKDGAIKIRKPNEGPDFKGASQHTQNFFMQPIPQFVPTGELNLSIKPEHKFDDSQDMINVAELPVIINEGKLERSRSHEVLENPNAVLQDSNTDNRSAFDNILQPLEEEDCSDNLSMGNQNIGNPVHALPVPKMKLTQCQPDKDMSRQSPLFSDSWKPHWGNEALKSFLRPIFIRSSTGLLLGAFLSHNIEWCD